MLNASAAYHENKDDLFAELKRLDPTIKSFYKNNKSADRNGVGNTEVNSNKAIDAK